MKTIFLDIDGVLNNAQTNEYSPAGFIGIDDILLTNLEKIINDTKSQIILISSWKEYWEKDGKSIDKDGIYIDEKFNKFGLVVSDKTIDNWSNRGEGIHNYITKHNIKKFAILDDEIFTDYKDFNLLDNLIKINSKLGITDEDVNNTIKFFE